MQLGLMLRIFQRIYLRSRPWHMLGQSVGSRHKKYRSSSPGYQGRSHNRCGLSCRRHWNKPSFEQCRRPRTGVSLASTVGSGSHSETGSRTMWASHRCCRTRTIPPVSCHRTVKYRWAPAGTGCFGEVPLSACGYLEHMDLVQRL